MDPFKKLKNKKTLLVEDDGLVRESLSMAFMSRGCDIRAVESAEEGIDVLQEEHFDIVVSDFKLPGMNGVEFFAMTGEHRSNSVKVLISGNVREEDLAGKEDLGIDEFLEKPFTVMTLVGMLADLIDNRENILNTVD